MRRSNNQDALGVMVTDDKATWATRGHLFMVADGMGAHAAGELASKLAVDNVLHTYFKLRDLYPPAALRQAIREANATIHHKGQSTVGFQGMGTTCSCLVLLPQGALVAHIGDSRVYRLRGDLLEQLTFDHSLVWEMAAAGQMTEKEVPAYIPKNVITRSLGPHPNVNIDLEGLFDAAVGDVFLLCSDGLSGQVTDEELGAILRSQSPEEAAQTLVDLANLRGGPDNISIIVAEIAGNGLPAEICEQAIESDGAPPAPQPESTSALPWFAAGIAVCLAIYGAYSLLSRDWLGAGVAGASAVAIVSLILWSRSKGGFKLSVTKSLGGPYGNGPYRKASAAPSREVVDALDEVAAKLRTLGDIHGIEWTVDWDVYRRERETAAAAAEAHDYATALRHHSAAIRDVMRQLRDRGTSAPSESEGE